MIKVSILTLFYKDNSKDFFCRYYSYIKKLVKYSEKFGLKIKVFILDNSPNPVLEQYIKLNNITVEKNIFIVARNVDGFAPGNNYLFQYSEKEVDSDYLLFLNPDIEIMPDCLMEMLITFKKYNNVFSVDAKQYPLEHPKEYNIETLETSWCSGACLLVDKNIFKKLGGFDERFFMYAEDVDLSWRAWEINNRCLYSPKAICVHHSFGYDKNSNFRQYWNIRNGLLMRIKHGTFLDIFKYIILIIKTILSSFDQGYFMESINLIKSLFNGFIFSFAYFPVLKNKNRPKFASFNGFEYATIRNNIK